MKKNIASLVFCLLLFASVLVIPKADYKSTVIVCFRHPSVTEKIYSVFHEEGYSDIAIAALLGNLKAESGLYPSAINKAGEGIGIAQWNFNRKEKLLQYAEYKGKDWRNLDIQIDFLYAEISGKGEASKFASQRKYGIIISDGTSKKVTSDDWKNAKTLDEATRAYAYFYEGVRFSHPLYKRCEYASRIYRKISASA